MANSMDRCPTYSKSLANLLYSYARSCLMTHGSGLWRTGFSILRSASVWDLNWLPPS